MITRRGVREAVLAIGILMALGAFAWTMDMAVPWTVGVPLMGLGAVLIALAGHKGEST